MTIKKLWLNQDLIQYSKVTILTQIKYFLFYKIPIWAIPYRQNKLIIIDKELNLTEIDL